ncbi:hypothetical protein K2173_015968 [Erythroxylum novogranatense]|uniref:Uncharacterized protein n=1 Tax=Erythroxylum novogranatense TaxID=1862640 RepID=A0AAV8SEV2_9ROSI|nr:hypothetical protein K2173_015968 [Erythroxylum novogranatense]
MTNGDMRGKTKRLVEKVEEYLMSDSYMYAPLFVPQLKNSPRGRIRLIGKVSTELSTRKMTKNN